MLVATLCLSLAACGGGGEPDADADADAGSGAAREPVVLRVPIPTTGPRSLDPVAGSSTLDNRGVVQAYDLFLDVRERVREEAGKLSLDQTPQYSPIRFAGHESGEFLFVSSGSPPDQAVGPAGTRRLRVAAARQPLRN